MTTATQTRPCPYRLRWESEPQTLAPKVETPDGRKRFMSRYYCKDAGFWIYEQADGSWTVQCSYEGGPNFAVETKGEKGLAEARKRAVAHDWARITRNHLTKVEKGVWEAAGGRIRVVKMTSPELNKAMPSGHVTTSGGYGIYVDGRYVECAFSVRKAQHEIGFEPEAANPNRHQQSRRRRYDMEAA